MAQQGQRVIVVDTDLRRPTQHHIFQIPNNIGLTNALLQDSGNLDRFIQNTQLSNLRVMTTGPLPPNPAELLSSGRFRQLIDQLKQIADIVLFDSPPALAVTDATILARQVDGVVLVINAGATRRHALTAAKEALSKDGVHILGIVLNRLRPQTGSYYYYYYRRYYTYGEEGEEKRESRQSKNGQGWRRWLPKTSQSR